MGDLIDRQAAIDALRKDVMGGLNYQGILKRLPSAEPEIIKCKDCRWSRGFATFACPMVGRINLKDDDFCSRGERRTDDCN